MIESAILKLLTSYACQEMDERVLTADFFQVFSSHITVGELKILTAPLRSAFP